VVDREAPVEDQATGAGSPVVERGAEQVGLVRGVAERLRELTEVRVRMTDGC
jgi:hypothetical protein